MSRLLNQLFIPVIAGKRAVTFAFAPTDIASLRYWVRGDLGLFQDAEGTTPATADGDVVGLWKDQSVNAYDVSQATTEKKPLLKLAANGINGKPAVLFDGSNDILVRTVANWLSDDSAGSVFVVLRLAATTDYQDFLASADEGSTNYYVMFSPYYNAGSYGQKFRVMQKNNDTADLIYSTDINVASKTYIGTIRSNGSAYTIRRNGVDQALNAETGSNTGDWFADAANRDNFSVGAVKRSSEAYFLNGLIAEIIVCGENLTGDDLVNMETYLADRYGITLVEYSTNFDGGSADNVRWEE